MALFNFPTLVSFQEIAYDYLGRLRAKHDPILGCRSWRDAFASYGDVTLFTVGTEIPTDAVLRLNALAIHNGEASEVVFTLKDDSTEIFVDIPVAAGQTIMLGPEDGLSAIEISTSLVVSASGAFSAGSEVWASCIPLLPGIIE